MGPLDLSIAEFQALADRVVGDAARYLALLDDRPGFPPTSGALTAGAFGAPVPEEGMGAAAMDGLALIAENARAGNGRFFAYVLGSGEPVAALGDLYASVLNQNVTSWRSAPSAVAVERTVIGWLAEAVGCAGFVGSMVGGGSSANLMGLAMAREAIAPANEDGARPSVVYASEEVHMSIPKAVALLGLGRANLRLIPVDEQFRMRVDLLDAAIAEDRRAGRQAIAVVASAGTVNTGSIDPLEAIAAVARQAGLWLHIDGAYGGLAAIAMPDQLAGLSFADSLSLDLHKWLYQPLDCSALLYRDADVARATFSHTGDYVKSHFDDPIEGFGFFDETIELSRRFRALKVWLSLRYHGLNGFRVAIREDLRRARLLADMVAAEPDLELLAPVELSAVCFRWHGEAERDLDGRNRAILERMLARGRVVLSNATIGGRFALRACVVNHRTTDDDIAAVISEVHAAAGETAPAD